MFKLNKRTSICDHKLFDVFFDDVETNNGESIPDFLVVAGFTTPDSGMLSAKIALFIAKDCSELQKYKPTEMGHSDFRFFDISEVDALIKNRELIDATTLINYYYYKLL
ncbi:MAG: hypothetical protein A3H42_00365 [Deltaproteobacteria bacterium RIFCSPLOWO2_02_FULL_46_8]|nr:MAG: hypothetical protein A3H42_00365 [Deltaproteobacteria bacterium RIFCSPLOWO2_02_FULL_46_8]